MFPRVFCNTDVTSPKETGNKSYSLCNVNKSVAPIIFEILFIYYLIFSAVVEDLFSSVIFVNTVVKQAYIFKFLKIIWSA